MTTVHSALRAAREAFLDAGIDTPDLDAELLVAHVLGRDRSWVLAHPEGRLDDAAAERLQALVARRARREPLAYILERRDFYDLTLWVTPAVLIPRPETEMLVERALDWLRAHPRARIADIGTGSGAIALALARHAPPTVTLYATDISPQALAVARENARRLGLEGRVVFLHGDLLAPLPEPIDLLVANLPYVPAPVRDDLMPEVREYEPAAALFSDADGLAHIRALLDQAPARMQSGGCILLEIGHDQGARARAIAQAAFPHAHVQIHPDLAGRDRILEVRL